MSMTAFGTNTATFERAIALKLAEAACPQAALPFAYRIINQDAIIPKKSTGGPSILKASII